MADTKVGRRGFVAGAGLVLAAPRLALAAPAAKPKVMIVTNHGSILIEIEDQKAPITGHNFLRYVDVKAYDGGEFYRAARDANAPKKGTIVGRPSDKNHPFPPIPHESTTKTGLRHVTGAVSLGRFEPGTATSNFFICASDEPYLDAHPGEKGDNLGYAVFGQVVQGMAVVHTILSLRTNGKTQYAAQRGQWLNPPVPIISMRRA